MNYLQYFIGGFIMGAMAMTVVGDVVGDRIDIDTYLRVAVIAFYFFVVIL